MSLACWASDRKRSRALFFFISASSSPPQRKGLPPSARVTRGSRGARRIYLIRNNLAAFGQTTPSGQRRIDQILAGTGNATPPRDPNDDDDYEDRRGRRPARRTGGRARTNED
jgi:hypothetical protein